MKKHIPNLFTLANAFCGCLGIVMCLQTPTNTAFASYLIFVACILDFSDGFVARALNAQSEIGKQLDSLADAITFGVLPAVLAYVFIQNASQNHPYGAYLKYFGFIMALASIWRLAKFNIDTRQSDSFLGVPTPANAIFWAAFPLIATYETMYIQHWAWFCILVVVFSFLMVCELPLFALKFKKFTWKDNQKTYIFLIVSILCFLFLRVYAFQVVIVLYVLLSLWLYLRSQKRFRIS